MDANGRSWGNALADGRCPNSRANGAEWDNSGQRPGFMRWNRRMFHTKARSHEGGWLVAPTTLVALRKRVWCLATFVDLVSHCPSHDSLRESQGDSAIKPGVTPSAALPRVWSGSAPQPRSGLCPTAHGCAAEALLWVTAQHINSPERVVPSHHQGRLSAGARIRQNGERHGWFSVSQATLNRVIHKLDASAQPRWVGNGVCGSALTDLPRWMGDNGVGVEAQSWPIPGVTPGFGAEHFRRFQRGKKVRSTLKSTELSHNIQPVAVEPDGHPASRSKESHHPRQRR